MTTRIDTGFFVNDIQRMVAFYRDVLGFAIEWNGQGAYTEFRNVFPNPKGLRDP